MKNRMTWIVFFLVNAPFAFATEAPDTGMLHNTSEDHSLIYDCNVDSLNTLHCDFTQTSVKKKAKPEDLAAVIEAAKNDFKNGNTLPEKECAMFDFLIDILEGSIAPPKEGALEKMSNLQKNDLLHSSQTMSAFCKNRSEENFIAIAKSAHEKETRTCKVMSHTFEQSFKLVQDHLSGGVSWVVKDGSPKGPCGLVRLSRFEKDKGNTYGLTFWKYYARKAVTNPSGTFTFGLSCKDLDENEYVYDWKSREHALGCDYIEFTPN